MNFVIPYHEDEEFINETFPIILEETFNNKKKVIEESHLDRDE